MTTYERLDDAGAEVVERVHALLELDGAQLLGRALGGFPVEQRLDDPVDEEAGEAHGDERDDQDQQDGDEALPNERGDIGGRDLGHGGKGSESGAPSGGVPSSQGASDAIPG